MIFYISILLFCINFIFQRAIFKIQTLNKVFQFHASQLSQHLFFLFLTLSTQQDLFIYYCLNQLLISSQLVLPLRLPWHLLLLPSSPPPSYLQPWLQLLRLLSRLLSLLFVFPSFSYSSRFALQLLPHLFQHLHHQPSCLMHQFHLTKRLIQHPPQPSIPSCLISSPTFSLL